MPIPTSRVNELLNTSRSRLEDLTAKIREHERAMVQLQRDALATHGAVQALELLATEASTEALTLGRQPESPVPNAA